MTLNYIAVFYRLWELHVAKALRIIKPRVLICVRISPLKSQDLAEKLIPEPNRFLPSYKVKLTVKIGSPPSWIIFLPGKVYGVLASGSGIRDYRVLLCTPWLPSFLAVARPYPSPNSIPPVIKGPYYNLFKFYLYLPPYLEGASDVSPQLPRGQMTMMWKATFASMTETPPVSSTIHNLITDTKIGLPAESSMTFLRAILWLVWKSPGVLIRRSWYLQLIRYHSGWLSPMRWAKARLSTLMLPLPVPPSSFVPRLTYCIGPFHGDVSSDL